MAARRATSEGTTPARAATGDAIVRRAPFSDNPRVGARGRRTQQRILDAALRVFADEGYHFVAAGMCQVPGAEHSGHLLYRRWGADRQPMLSVFVVPDRHQFALQYNGRFQELQPLRQYCVQSASRCHGHVCLFTDGDTLYFVTGCDPAKVPEAAQMLEEAVAASGR